MEGEGGSAEASHTLEVSRADGRQVPRQVIHVSEDEIYANLARMWEDERPTFFGAVKRRLSDGLHGARYSLQQVFARNGSPREGGYFYGLPSGRRSLRERVVHLVTRSGHANPRGDWRVTAVPVLAERSTQVPVARVEAFRSAPSPALTGVSSGLELVLAPDVSDAYIADKDYGVFIARERDRANVLAHLYKEQAGGVADGYAASKLEGRTLYGGAKAAVEGKRQRLETFAEIYAGLGGTERGADESVRVQARAKAAAAVGITSARTIDDYVARVENGGRNRSREP
ncbi:MAG: hypothetical protein ACMXYM_02300 [Candidatus Woesearchaeota archaeon]